MHDGLHEYVLPEARQAEARGYAAWTRLRVDLSEMWTILFDSANTDDPQMSVRFDLKNCSLSRLKLFIGIPPILRTLSRIDTH